MATAKQQLRAWLKDHVGEDGYEVEAVVAAACEHFMSDPDFLCAYATETFSAFVHDVLGTIRYKNRLLALGGDVVTAETLAERAAAWQQKFSKWQENAAPGRFVPLLQMTKPELLFAAEQREVQGVENLRRAAMCRTLATRLRGSDTVSDRWSPEELHTLYDSITIKTPTIKAG